MLTYAAEETFAHGLDPRAKLAFQFGFAIAAFSLDRPVPLAALTVLALVALASARGSALTLLRRAWFLLLLLATGPLLSAVVLEPPWIDPALAVAPALSGYRVVLVLFVSGAYVRSTTVRKSRAAIQHTLPGRFGTSLGIGVELVFRFFPLLRSDLGRIRDAMAARAGQRRSAVDRMRRFALLGLQRAFGRADRLALALQARCFAWNPTLPVLSFRPRDVPVLLLGAALALSPLVPTLAGAIGT